MDILNFFSWIKGGKYSPTVPNNAVTVIGVPNPKRGDAYLPVTVPVSAFGGGSNIGKLLGGGIVVAEWDELGVKKALIASLTNLSTSLKWTLPAFQSTAIGSSAQSFSDGSGNTDAIIAQTGAAATTAYAAGRARLYLSGGYNDWYLPSSWELTMCYNSAGIVNKVLGSVNGFAGNFYWSSTEDLGGTAWIQYFFNGFQGSGGKGGGNNVRAVRTHTL